jgi:hypothetical protein
MAISSKICILPFVILISYDLGSVCLISTQMEKKEKGKRKKQRAN